MTIVEGMNPVTTAMIHIELGQMWREPDVVDMIQIRDHVDTQTGLNGASQRMCLPVKPCGSVFVWLKACLPSSSSVFFCMPLHVSVLMYIYSRVCVFECLHSLMCMSV